LRVVQKPETYYFLPSLLGLHFSQTFFSLVAATQHLCSQALPAAIALSQQVGSAWHFSQVFPALCASTQQLWVQSLPAAFALTQQLCAIAPLVLSTKAAAQAITVSVLLNFIVVPLLSAECLIWHRSHPHSWKTLAATWPRAFKELESPQFTALGGNVHKCF
jgi:hypothetical protein